MEVIAQQQLQTMLAGRQVDDGFGLAAAEMDDLVAGWQGLISSAAGHPY
jgi:hypothetical protein